MAKRAKTIDLLRVVDLLQEHITPALCRTVFGAVRKTERQRVWTLEALIRFWTAVVLRAPKALSQALVDSLEGRDPTYPRVEASPEAFFQRCRDLRPAFFAEVFQRFTTRLVTAVPPRYAAEVAPVRARFTALVILDGSRLAAIAHRLKLLWNERAVVLPGCLLGVYDVGRGLCRQLSFCADAAASEMTRAKAALAELSRDTLVLGDRLYGTADFLCGPGPSALLGGRPAQSATEPGQAPAPAQASNPRRATRGLGGARRHWGHRPLPGAALHSLAPREHALRAAHECARPHALERRGSAGLVPLSLERRADALRSQGSAQSQSPLRRQPQCRRHAGLRRGDRLQRPAGGSERRRGAGGVGARTTLAGEVLPQSRHGHLSLPASTTMGTRDSDPVSSPPSPTRRWPPALGPSGARPRAGRTPRRPPSHPAVLPRAASLEIVRACARRAPLHQVILAAMSVREATNPRRDNSAATKYSPAIPA